MLSTRRPLVSILDRVLDRLASAQAVPDGDPESVLQAARVVHTTLNELAFPNPVSARNLLLRAQRSRNYTSMSRRTGRLNNAGACNATFQNID